MSKFYTNIAVVGSNVFVREIVDGIPNKRKDHWQPTLYVKGVGTGKKFSSLYGDQCYSVQPGSIAECRDFVKRYDGVSGFEIFGQLNYALQYANEYPLQDWQYRLVQSWGIDIETKVPEDENGKTFFPKPGTALGEILLITMINMHTGDKFTFGSKPYNGKDTHYTCMVSEEAMLKSFIQFWEQRGVDVITGWNIEQFDIPYLINRITNVLGEEWASKLSPWGRVSCKERSFKGRDEYDVELLGVSILDLISLYKKFTYVKQEAYSLGFIAQEELGHTKVDHSEYATFNEFWQKDWEKFTHYNIVDAELVKKLDDKLRLIELALTMAYDAKINYQDVYSPVKFWDAVIHNHCLAMDIVVPQQQRERSLPLDGAYVKEPVPGWYEDGGSVDATSLYPSNIITNNISPETYEGNIGLTIDEALMRRDHGIVDRVVTPVGAIYSKAKRGILPELVEHFMKRRKSVKGEMLRLEQLYEDTKDESLKNKIAALDNEQMAIKISLNSLYGATANEHFRFFKYDHAASITLTGQFVLRTIEERIDRELNQLFGTGEAKYLIYIDTDSLYFTFKPVMDKFKVPDSAKIKAIEKTILEKVTPIVNAICADCCKYMNSYENRLNFKLEIAFDKAIWVGKKKYAIRAHSSEGVTYSKPKFKVKGLEMVRSSTPRFVRDKLKDALELIFNGTEKEVQRYIESVRSDFMKLPYQQTAFPRSANNLDEYSDKKYIYVSSKTGAKGATTPIQVRGALLYNHYLKEMGLDGKYPLIGEGEKIKFCYLRLPNRLRENIISFPAEGVIPDEFGVVKQVDSDMQFEKTFLASMEILLDAIKWSAIEHSSLEDFFA